MQLFNSIYLGIVVQNNDPEKRGRVKVWVPYISTTVYNKWNELKKDQKFGFPGSPGGENFSAILEELKDTLPWAECASPVFGASSTGYYNSRFDVNSVSDAPLLYGQPGSNTTSTSSATNIDPENKGGKPGALYENYPVGDAFNNTSKINSLYVNQYSNNYKPATYSNAAKGIFSIPNVGAHVWVFFSEGVPQYPVYVAASFGQDDFESIFKSGDNTFPDYPDTFENKDKRAQPDINADTTTYRNKLVINQRGAAIEIINTTDRESYKVSHYKGSYYELNNKFTALFNTGNFQLLTLRDKFETVRGHNNSFVARNSDNIIQGDHYLKVGNFSEESMNIWSSLMNKITTAGNANPLSIGDMLKSLTGSMADQEKRTGFGGNSFELISKHKTVVVGLSVNEAAPYNIDSTNKYSLSVAVSPLFKETGLFDTIELLYVPDMPGGNYDIFANNKFTAKSGAGGTQIQTLGQLKLSGPIIDVRGAQVNIGGGREVNITGTGLTKITSDVLYLKSKGQVYVDSNLGVGSNMVINGGLYVNGEMTVNHITAPIEYQVTENTQIVATGPVTNLGVPGQVATGWNIVNAQPIGSVTLVFPPFESSLGGSVQAQIVAGTLSLNTYGAGVLTIAQPHSHVFKNIPLTLLEKNPASPINAFNAEATLKYRPDKTEPIAAESRLDGRIATIGIPPPTVFATLDGNPLNFPNGPGSNIAGPRIAPI